MTLHQRWVAFNCERITKLQAQAGHLDKQKAVADALSSFKNPLLLLTMLLPKHEKRVYNLKVLSISPQHVQQVSIISLNIS